MKHAIRNLAVFGGVLVTASVAFEYVRMAPSYRLIVEPWSIRGYDLTQGRVVAALGIGSIIITLLAASKQGSPVFNALVGFGIWLAAILIAQFPDPEPLTLELASFPALAILAVLSYILTRTIMNLAGDRIGTDHRRYVKWGLFAAILAISFLAIARPNFVVPNSLETDLSVVIAVVLGVIVIAATIAPPRQLAVARLAMITALMSWATIGTVGTSARTKLIQSQIEVMGVSGTYRDTQITSGVMIAFAGIVMVFLATVGIWARKRDRLEVIARAKRQQDAAAQSAAELAAAGR